MRNDKENVIVDLTFKFALDIVKYCQKLEDNKKFVISKQILKCGTSIGANVREAQNGESKIDFIHKMKIASKEADELQYWLLICKESEGFPDCSEPLEKIDGIIKMLSKIIGTSKRNIGFHNSSSN